MTDQFCWYCRVHLQPDLLQAFLGGILSSHPDREMAAMDDPSDDHDFHRLHSGTFVRHHFLMR